MDNGALASASSLTDLFDRVCAVQPDALAVENGARRLTYSELGSAAETLATGLSARGVQRGDRVGLQVRRSLEIPIGILGILKAGAAYVPLDPGYPADRLHSIIEDAGVRVVVGDQHYAMYSTIGPDSYVSPIQPGRAGIPASSPPDAIDPAYAIFTSGSTGRPKGCLITHGNVLSLLRAALPLFEVDARDRWTLFHSVNFDFSVWEIWGAFATGGTVVIVPDDAARSSHELLDLLVREKITVLNQVPSSLRALTLASDLADWPGTAVRYLISGGESVNLDVIRRFLDGMPGQPRPTVVNMYGITEATVHVTCKILAAADYCSARRSPIGRPLPHLTVELRDAHGTEVAIGEVGEIWVSGAGVAGGYLNRPELTADRFVTENGRTFYRSGDLARLDPDGELEFLGRADRQVKFRGFRIEPEEIECALRGHDSVHDAAVTLVTGHHGAQRLVAYVVPAENFAAADVRAYLSESLPAHMVPTRYLTVSSLPVSASGKLDRVILATPEQS